MTIALSITISQPEKLSMGQKSHIGGSMMVIMDQEISVMQNALTIRLFYNDVIILH